ncbi:aldehyde dehydrogenase family protein [Streptomyces sp. NPDC058441]|uniref:aldehyde dehydrogenase family protein n=1 Tax=Streptomyces sp. NPDC058441 TaxID=3346502 RepID=UPI0036686E2C
MRGLAFSGQASDGLRHATALNDAALTAMDRAFRTGPWPTSTPSERAALRLRIADEVETRAAQMALTNTLENGSSISETRGAASNLEGTELVRADHLRHLPDSLEEPTEEAPGRLPCCAGSGRGCRAGCRTGRPRARGTSARR